MPVHDLKLVLDTWRMHTDPHRETVDAADQFDRRAVHLSSLLDGVGRLDGTLDPDGYLLLREAIRSLSQPGEDETRTAAHRRHDALIQMAKIVLATIDTVPGTKRRTLDRPSSPPPQPAIWPPRPEAARSTLVAIARSCRSTPCGDTRVTVICTGT